MKTKGKQSKNDRMKKGKMVHPKKACSLSGNSNKMRYPEEIPKTYRRKGIRQKRTKEDRRHEEKTAGGRKLSSPKARYYHYKTSEETRLRVDTGQERGGG